MRAGIDALSDMMELHRAGRIRIIATSGAKRSPLLPGVATFREQGFASIEGSGWIGVYGPAKTPRAIIDQLSSAIVNALQYLVMLKQSAMQLGERLQCAAVPVTLTINDEENAFNQALYLLLRRRLTELAGNGRLRPTSRGEPLLAYYRNAIPPALRVA